VLEGLDEVPWRELQHAYGRADDVPGQIRDLLSGKPKRREAALYELFGNIHHQATLYAATAPAVPFLAEIARSKEAHPRVRIELLWLLDAIAGGGTDAYGRVQGEVARAAKDAVLAELPTLLPLIEAADDATALSAATLAARFPDAADASAPLVRARFEDARDECARQLLAGVLVILGDRDDELRALVRSAPDENVDREYLDSFPEGEPYLVLEDLLGAALQDRLPEHE
jgi:hypothetical protein